MLAHRCLSVGHHCRQQERFCRFPQAFRIILGCKAEDAAHRAPLTGDLESVSSPGNRGVVSHAVVGLSCLRPSIVRAGAHNARPMCGRDQTCPISNYISGGLRLSAASGSLSHGVAGAAETSHGAAPTISPGYASSGRLSGVVEFHGVRKQELRS